MLRLPMFNLTSWIVAGSLFLMASSPMVADSNNATAFAYDDWATVLERYVDDEGLVDYAALAEDRAGLDRVLAQIAAASPDSHATQFPSRDAQLAYFINAYNALIFDGVLDKGPDVDSVWGITGTGYGFFVRRKVVLGGETTNLKKLEDDQVRARFADPRIHAALNCASLGCPRLPREPFLPATLDAQLDAAMREFVADPRHVAFDPADGKTGTVTMSKIFDWFTDDFLDFERTQGAAGEPSLIGYINRYRDDDAQIPADARVRFGDYDKGLNRQP